MSSSDASLDQVFDPRFQPVDPSHVCCHVTRGMRCEIRSYSMCNVLTGDAIEQLEQLARPTIFPSRAQLQGQGEPVDAVYNLTAGMVRISKMLTDGRRQVVGFALPGDFLGLGPSERHIYSADTLTRVTACHFDGRNFRRFMTQQPGLVRRLYDLTRRELEIAHHHIALLAGRTAEEKLACFLLVLRAQYGRRFGLSNTIALPMSRQDIADYLGMTIETVSRMFTRFDKNGLLAVARDSVRILDTVRLEALAAL